MLLHTANAAATEKRKICLELQNLILKRLGQGYMDASLPTPKQLYTRAFTVNSLETHLRKIKVIPSRQAFQAWRFGTPAPMLFEKRPRDQSPPSSSPRKSPRPLQQPLPESSEDSDCVMVG